MSAFDNTVDGLPVSNILTENVSDIPTTIQCSSYSDRHMIVISQLGKFGTWISAWSEQCQDGRILYETQVLLGKRDDAILHIYARQIIEVVSKVSNKPIVLAISLEDSKEARSAAAMQTILNKLFEINTWQ